MLRCFLTEKKWYVILWFLQCSLRHNTLPSQIRVISEVLTNEPWNIKKRQLGNFGVCSKTFVTNICYESHFDNAPYFTPFTPFHWGLLWLQLQQWPAIMPCLKFTKVLSCSCVTMFMGQTNQSISIPLMYLVRLGLLSIICATVYSKVVI